MQDKDRENANNSRRSFLKTAIVGSVTAVASGAALAGPAGAFAETNTPCVSEKSWEKPAAPIADSKIKETIEVDVVVVGAGVAGLAAAHAAAESGAKVVLLEKTKTFSARGYANGAINTKVHKKLGVDLDKEQIVGELVRWASNRVQQQLLRTWADKSGEVLDYYIDLAEANGLIVHLDDESFAISPFYKEYRTAISFRKPEDTGWFYQGRIAGLIEQEARKRGADIRYSTPAQQLVKDAKSGRIIGVIGKQQGAYTKFIAKKGVILATGDYGSNPEMVAAWAPLLRKADANIYTPVGANTGDGIKIAMWQGATVQDAPHPLMLHVVPGIGCDLMCSNQTFLHVNRNGLRYENEAQPLQGVCDGRFMQPGNKCWAVFDSKYLHDHEALEKAPFGPIVEPLEKLEESVQNKLAFKADTIEELADKIGVQRDALAKTVGRYTELARNRVDEDFAKPSRLLLTIERSPFYALPIPVHQLVVVGGLDVDGESRVVDKNGDVIAGLFAIGNVAGNFFANDYPLTAPGLSHGRCLTLGRLLGQTLANS
jgi:fumarate reductase flavoprotein subunit